MILVDANVLLYAYDPRASAHQRCRAWVERSFSGEEPVAIAWVTLLAFLRISTNPRAYERPLLSSEALAIVRSWVAQPAVMVLEAGEACWDIFQQLVADADTGVQWDHPALKRQYRGWDGANVDHDYNWHDATDSHSPVPVDPHSHGTFTTTQVAGWRSCSRR